MSDDSLAELLKTQREIIARLDNAAKWREEFNAMFAAHMSEETHTFEQHEARMNRIEFAFLRDIDGKPDFSGHRDDHKTRIEGMATWIKRREKIVETLMTGIAWAVVVAIGAGILQAIKGIT